jgi:hypothetical protein
MKPLATLTKEASVAVCFQCHATKDMIREEPYLPGEPLEKYFSVKFPQFEETYTADGRVRNFGYQGNHLYSDCYLNGSMTCVDCHDPHSQQYRDVWGKPLAGRFDNGQCTSCHASKGLSPEQHSHHKSDSAGNLCTSCHMPYLQHRGIGQHLHFARSDHSIPIPRPAFDHNLGIENACQNCHGDHDLAWQEARVREWYGEIKPQHPMVANVLKAKETADFHAAAGLLLSPVENHPIAQAEGLIEFLKLLGKSETANVPRFTQPEIENDPQILRQLLNLANNSDPDLQALALAALHLGFADKSEAAQLCAGKLAILPSDDPVRSRWAVAEAYRGDFFANQRDPRNAVYCFKHSLQVQPASVVTLSHLAMAYLNMDAAADAQDTLKTAIGIEPWRGVLHFQLALTYQRQQNNPEAVRELQEGLKFAPDDASANRMLRQIQGQ